ncbi:hypothetical protein E5082_29995 [Streptomyces griseoluteus]|uniref:Uncharacterized protein n=1 Tax=Streptomyces griseoluteus TaxID=29306 RepID=A0A4Z1CYQ6_STRGP|nr:hypothetical protein E5082_29995 [Streptomyces griseoluteus]
MDAASPWCFCTPAVLELVPRRCRSSQSSRAARDEASISSPSLPSSAELDPRLPSPFTPDGSRPTGPAWYQTHTVAYAQELGYDVLWSPARPPRDRGKPSRSTSTGRARAGTCTSTVTPL